MTDAPQSLSCEQPLSCGDVALPANVHATAIALGELGVLIRGESGAGKTSLARALLAAAGLRGLFARLVGDDRICISFAGGRLIARPHPTIAGLVEIRGQGICKLPHEQAAHLHALIDLVGDSKNRAYHPRFPEKSHMLARFGGIILPRLRLPADRPAADNAASAMVFLESILPPVSK